MSSSSADALTLDRQAVEAKLDTCDKETPVIWGLPLIGVKNIDNSNIKTYGKVVVNWEPLLTYWNKIDEHTITPPHIKVVPAGVRLVYKFTRQTGVTLPKKRIVIAYVVDEDNCVVYYGSCVYHASEDGPAWNKANHRHTALVRLLKKPQVLVMKIPRDKNLKINYQRIDHKLLHIQTSKRRTESIVNLATIPLPCIRTYGRTKIDWTALIEEHRLLDKRVQKKLQKEKKAETQIATNLPLPKGVRLFYYKEKLDSIERRVVFAFLVDPDRKGLYFAFSIGSLPAGQTWDYLDRVDHRTTALKRLFKKPRYLQFEQEPERSMGATVSASHDVTRYRYRSGWVDSLCKLLVQQVPAYKN